MGKFRLKQNVGKHYMQTSTGDLTRIEPGQIITCADDEIAAHIDKFDVIEPSKPAAPKHQLKVVHVGGGKYNVLHPVTSKPLNTKSLTKQEAETLAGMTLAEAEELLKPDEDEDEG